MTIAFSVNSAGDCGRGHVGLKAGRRGGASALTGVAMARDISTRVLLQSGVWLVKTTNKGPVAAAPGKQSRRSGFRAHDQPAFGLPALPQRARGIAGVRTISSQALAEQFHLNAAQIRKDLAYFGEFGVRGVGYYVRDLKRHLRQILGLDRKLRVAIMGAGNLGLALADYPGFPPGRLRDRGALRQRCARRSASSRAAACRSTTSTI